MSTLIHTWKIALEHAMTQADAANNRVVMALERIKRKAALRVAKQQRNSRAVDYAVRDIELSEWQERQTMQANDPELLDAIGDFKLWSSEAQRYALAITAFKLLGLH